MGRVIGRVFKVTRPKKTVDLDKQEKKEQAKKNVEKSSEKENSETGDE